MSKNNLITATIDILGKPYAIRCPEAEMEALQRAAHFLNGKMQEIQRSGKAINTERIAIMAALNLSHQFLQMEQQKTSLMQSIQQRIEHLQTKLDSAMTQPVQADLLEIVNE